MSEDQTTSLAPRIVSREHTPLSEWVTLEAVSVADVGSPGKIEVFHAFRQADYVHVLAMTTSDCFVLVRQYRPVVEAWTLELPGGLRDAGEDPEVTAARELREETGFSVVELVPLIECYADVGRLPNRFHGFFAVAKAVAEPERGIKPVLLTGKELQTRAVEGRIASANHIALLYLAAVNPQVQELCRRYNCVAPAWI